MKPQKVFVSGHFNVLHPGHNRLLRFAKNSGSKLIVGVISDRVAGAKALLPEELRLECVQASTWVDQAFIIDKAVVEVLKDIRPDLVVKGKEHEFLINPELDVLNTYGGRLIFSSGETTFASVDLIKREVSEINTRSIALPMEYLERHKITAKDLHVLLKKFSDLRVCVIGDLIVDEYISCEPLGMSQEDPTIVVRPIDSQRFVGGAGIVAAHAAGVGADVSFVSVCGDDEVAGYAKEELDRIGVEAILFKDQDRPTTLKQRYRSSGKSLLRVSDLSQVSISAKLQQRFLEKIAKLIANTDLLVFSDFNYGCLPQELVQEVIKICNDREIKFVADSQSSSQTGDISRFANMDLITPTEREARISTRNTDDGLVVLAEKLRQQADPENILLTLGSEGLLVHTCPEGKADWVTDRIPALNSAPRDVAGAGDSLLIFSGMALAAKATIWEAALLGSLAAGVQVSRVGNTPIRITEFSDILS